MLYTLTPRRLDLLCSRGQDSLLLQYNHREAGAYASGKLLWRGRVCAWLMLCTLLYRILTYVCL